VATSDRARRLRRTAVIAYGISVAIWTVLIIAAVLGALDWSWVVRIGILCGVVPAVIVIVNRFVDES